MTFLQKMLKIFMLRKGSNLIAVSAVCSAVFLLLITGSVSNYFLELSQSITKNFEGKIFLCEKKSFWIGGGLISEEKLPIIKSLKGVDKVIPMLISRLSSDEMVIVGVPFVVVGIPPENVNDFSSNIDASALKNKNSVVLGWDIAKSKKLSRGSKINIRGTEFIVSEICNKTSSITDRQAVVPLVTLQEVLSREHLLTCIIITLQKGVHLEITLDDISKKINWLQVITPDELENGMQESSDFWNALTIIFMLISGIGSIFSLSTLSVMFVSERKKEIAMKKAIGAENKHLFKEFVIHSLTVTILGWFGGLIVTYLFILISSFLPFTKDVNVFKINFLLIVVSFLWSCIISILSCLVPLNKIMSMNIANTLRS